MPGGEPDMSPAPDSAGASRDSFDGIERIARRNERREPGHFHHRAHLSSKKRAPKPSSANDSQPIESASGPIDAGASQTGATLHGVQEGYRAPAEPPEDYQPPKLTRNGRPAGMPAPQQGHRRRNRIGCIIAAIIFFSISANVLGLIASSCSALIDDIFEGDSGYDGYSDTAYDSYGDDYDYDLEYQIEDESEALATEQVEDLLARIAAGDAELVARGVEQVEDTFQSYYELTPAEMGVDAEAFVRWQFAQMTYQVESVYAYVDPASDGFSLEGTVYVDIQMPTLNDLLYDLSDYIYYDLGYDSYDHPLEAGDPELIAAELERLKAEVEPSDIYRSADFTGTAAQDGSDITLEMDLTDLQEEILSSAL